MIVTDTCKKLSLDNKVHNHIVSLITFEEAIYSASTDKVATESYFFNNHNTKLSATSKRKLFTECLLLNSCI